MSDNIYALYFGDDAVRAYFYVGHTTDPERRLKEHKRSAVNGTEDKYQYIRQELDPHNIKWDMEVIKTIPDGEYPPDYERYYVIKYTLEGHPLQNMKHGDLSKRKELEEQLADTSIRSVESVRADRLRREKLAQEEQERKAFEKSEKLRKKIEEEKRQAEREEMIRATLDFRRKKALEIQEEIMRKSEERKKQREIEEAEQAEKLRLKKIRDDKRALELAELRKQQDIEWRAICSRIEEQRKGDEERTLAEKQARVLAQQKAMERNRLTNKLISKSRQERDSAIVEMTLNALRRSKS